MKSVHAFVVFMFLSMICVGDSVYYKGDHYVRDACRVTRYRGLCIHTLARFSNYAKRSPWRWAQAGVAVTMREARNDLKFLILLKKQVNFRRRQRIALSDCIEVVADTLDNLSLSFGELKKLEARTFELQMGNVETWMSAAMSDEDTCSDGFSGRRGKRVRMINNKIMKLGNMTSNALALVTKLASYHIEEV